jgi:hypothetical protein
MRRFLLTAATAATALVGTACGDVTGIGGNVTGSYELRTINGQSLPVDMGSAIIEGGVLEIFSDGTFAETIQFREFGSPLSEQIDLDGTWDRDGDDIILEYDNGDVFRADRTSSSRIVYEDDDGNDWAYQRF